MVVVIRYYISSRQRHDTKKNLFNKFDTTRTLLYIVCWNPSFNLSDIVLDFWPANQPSRCVEFKLHKPIKFAA